MRCKHCHEQIEMAGWSWPRFNDNLDIVDSEHVEMWTATSGDDQTFICEPRLDGAFHEPEENNETE